MGIILVTIAVCSVGVTAFIFLLVAKVDVATVLFRLFVTCALILLLALTASLVLTSPW